MTGKSHTNNHSSILMVTTAVILKTTVAAVYQVGLITRAVCIIQPDGASSRAEECIHGCGNGLPTTYLPTNHLSILHVPAIVTHHTPLTIMVQLHSALTSVTAARKPH